MNNSQSEFCRHPHHPSGCGWLIVGAVALVVLVASAAGIYHEVQFHRDPVQRDSIQIDTSLLDHSELVPDYVVIDTVIMMPTYDSIAKTRRDSL